MASVSSAHILDNVSLVPKTVSQMTGISQCASGILSLVTDSNINTGRPLQRPKRLRLVPGEMLHTAPSYRRDP